MKASEDSGNRGRTERCEKSCVKVRVVENEKFVLFKGAHMRNLVQADNVIRGARVTRNKTACGLANVKIKGNK